MVLVPTRQIFIIYTTHITVTLDSILKKLSLNCVIYSVHILFREQMLKYDKATFLVENQKIL